MLGQEMATAGRGEVYLPETWRRKNVASDIFTLIERCFSNDPKERKEARRQFQEEYGPAIYNFPVKIYRLPEDVAGDFYVYVFDRDRIFHRVRKFEGRNNIQFRTFLSYYILESLYIEWRRTTNKTIPTVSLDEPRGQDEEQGGGTWLETLASEDPMPESEDPQEKSWARQILDSLKPDDLLYLKVYYLAEWTFEAKDIRDLAQKSRRPVDVVLGLIDEVRHKLSQKTMQKDEQFSHLEDNLEALRINILLLQRELQKIDAELHHIPSQANALIRQSLTDRKAELEAEITKKIARRQKKRAKMLAMVRTTPYKDIVTIFNQPLGTVSARITRLKQRLLGEEAGVGENEEKS